MAEVIIRPDALVGTATGFDTDLDTVAGLGKINDDSDSTAIEQNSTTANFQVTMGNSADYSGATINSIQAFVRGVPGRSGEASVTLKVLNAANSGLQNGTLSFESGNSTQTLGTITSGLTPTVVDGLQLFIGPDENGISIIDCWIVVDFTAAANPFISKISGIVIGSVNKVSSLAKTSMAKVIAVVNYFDRSAVAKSISTGTSEAVYISDSNGSYRVDHNDAFSVSFWIKVGWNVSVNATCHMFSSADVGAAGANADVFRVWYYEPHNRIYAEWRSGSSEKKHNFWFFHSNSSSNNNSAVAFAAAGLGTTFWNSSNRGNANSDGYTLITVTRGTTNSAASSNLNLYWNDATCGIGFYASGGGSGTPNMGNSTDKQIAIGSNSWDFSDCGNNDETKYNGVTVWDKKLTSSEVTELYNSGTPMDVSTHSAYANCTGWWNFEDTNGTNLISGGPDFDQINGNSNIGPI